MTIAALTALVASICINPSLYTHTESVNCIEELTNCAVIGAGEVKSDLQPCFDKLEQERAK